ncbi:MAG: SMP-30/gluconolactonase/LRE family protein [Sedimentisphaerales bacterium]|nr:SMP-30/gluconolactonase/LRE family protein [Sedimentisphaerales bacterium]
MSVKRSANLVIVLFMAWGLIAGGCAKKEDKLGEKSEAKGRTGLRKAELLVELPDYCNTPDGMALLADNSIVLSVPNYNDANAGAFIMKISADNKVSNFFTPPPHPKTKIAAPMGICLGPSGDLYYADNQFFQTPHSSRVMRIAMKDGQPQEAVTAFSGMNVANAVVIKDDCLYVSDTVLVPDSKPLISGIFRFKLDEEGVEIKTPIEEDPHLIAKITSQNPAIGFGADGLCFDSKGNLYCGNFADGTIHKITFDEQGKVTSNTIWVKTEKMKCADGLCCDKKTGRILVADMVQNAIQMIGPDGRVETIAMNGDTNGADGGLDQPCEAIFRGDEVIISNMDWPFEGVVNTKWDKPYTLSVVKLK